MIFLSIVLVKIDNTILRLLFLFFCLPRTQWFILLSSRGASPPCGLPEPGGFERVFLGLGPGAQQGLPRLQKQAGQHLPSQPQTRWDLRCTRQVFRWESFYFKTLDNHLAVSGWLIVTTLYPWLICFHEFFIPHFSGLGHGWGHLGVRSRRSVSWPRLPWSTRQETPHHDFCRLGTLWNHNEVPGRTRS